MNDDLCVGCGDELLEIDKDPNGDKNATCKRCLAEEDHDYDLDPHAVFNRIGERTDTPRQPKSAFTAVPYKPDRLIVDAKLLESWARQLDCDRESFDQDKARSTAREIRGMIKDSRERKAKRKVK